MAARAEITPEMKVEEFLRLYPELEQVLISASPVFQKLKNPILRRTIGHVATLEKAAHIAGLNPRMLIRRLRQAAGRPFDPEDAASDLDEPSPDSQPRPDWADPARVRETVDADAILADSSNPLSHVKRRLDALEPGSILLLKSSFRPVPLIEWADKGGRRVFTQQLAEDRFETFISADKLE